MADIPSAPWRYAPHAFGIAHIIMDADGRHLASNVPASAGPLMAAGPELLDRMARIARLTSAGSPANAIAKSTLREYGYQRAKLRIVGVAG
jgi:hypothetical protein